jgi:hypothetical protein
VDGFAASVTHGAETAHPDTVRGAIRTLDILVERSAAVVAVSNVPRFAIISSDPIAAQRTPAGRFSRGPVDGGVWNFVHEA